MKNRVALLILTLDVGPLGHKHLYYFRVFFLSCVFIAGLFGAATANRKILFIQSLPAAIGLLLTLLL